MKKQNREPLQWERVFALMKDGHWRTIPEIRRALYVYGSGDLLMETSISARLRDLRKPFYGSHNVERRARGRNRGLYEYRVVINDR